MASDPQNFKIPLTQQDQEALSQIFAQLKMEDIKQIEANNPDSFVILEPWEEQGWTINSSLPSKNV